MNTYEPFEFIQRLSANDLPDNDAVTIAGLVRQEAGTTEVIQFSASTSCERWLTIPVSMIENVTYLRNAKCKDHQHPLVKIRLKPSDAPGSDVAFLLGLVSELQRTAARLALSKTDGQVIPYDFEDCYTLISNGNVYVCCGNPPSCTGVALM